MVSISDDDDGSDTEDHFRLPLFQMTQEELGEELKVFNTSSDAPKISGDLEFRHAEVSSVRYRFCCLKTSSCRIC